MRETGSARKNEKVSLKVIVSSINLVHANADYSIQSHAAAIRHCDVL